MCTYDNGGHIYISNMMSANKLNYHNHIYIWSRVITY